MANPEHLMILKQGGKVWNEWRLKNQGVKADLVETKLKKADLSGADLSEFDIRGANLREVDLRGANLSGTDLMKVDLRRAKLSKANLSKANLNVFDLRETDLSETDLTETDLREANLYKADLREANLYRAHLSRANLREACLRGAVLREANLSESRLSETDLREADLREANLNKADLRIANLNRAHLSGANLRDTCLRGIILRKAILIRADLREADLTKANLTEANLSKADLSKARLPNVDLIKSELVKTNLCESSIGNTKFGDQDLSQTKNLDKVHHHGPSTIGIDSIYKSKGMIPEVFLRSCGLSPWEIEMCRLYNPDLTPNEISEIISTELFSKRTKKFPFHRGVFISYSHSDSDFVDKLRNCLMDSGFVTVWLDKHDMEAGDIQKQVHRQLRMQDIVLVVLSENSIESDWVENELRLARKIEKEEKRDALCPVCLDNSWKEKMDDVLWGRLGKKFIVDFSVWKTKKFGGQFTKLLNGILKNYEKRAGLKDGES